MADRVIVKKVASLERRVARVREEYIGNEAAFATDFRIQDAAVLNLVRACEQAIDLANRLIRLRRYEPADDAREAFATLARHGLIGSELEASMRAMVGFRNIAVHEYQELDIGKVRAVIEHRLDGLRALAAAALAADPTR